MTTRRRLALLALVLLVPVAAADGVAGHSGDGPDVDLARRGVKTCFGVQLEGPAGPVVPTEPCAEGGDAITIEGVLREGRAAAGIVFRLQARAFAARPDLEGPIGAGNVPAPALSAVTMRVAAHVEWDAGCADPRGGFAVQAQDETHAHEVPSLALARLCGAGSLEATRLAIVAALRELARDLAQVSPEAGALAQALVDGLPDEPAPDAQAPPMPVDDRRHVEADAEALLRADPEQTSAEADADASAEAGGVRVAPASVEAQPVPPPAPLATQELDQKGTKEEGSVPPPPPSAAPSPSSALAPAAAPTLAPTPERAPPAPRAAPAHVAADIIHAAPPPTLPRTAAAAAAGAAGALVLLAAVALYQRMGRHSALAHPTRAALHRAVLDAGAAPVGPLAAAVGAPRKQTEYHLRYLVRAGILLAHERPDAPTLYAAPGARKPETPQEPLAARLLDTLRARPGRSTLELAREAGVGYGRVDRRLKDLLREGAVESRVEAGERRYFAAVA